MLVALTQNQAQINQIESNSNLMGFWQQTPFRALDPAWHSQGQAIVLPPSGWSLAWAVQPCSTPVIQRNKPKWCQHISQLVRQLPADAASVSGTQKCLMQASIIRHWRKVNKHLFCNLGLTLKHGLQDRWNSLPQWKVTQSPCTLCKTRERNWCCEEGALSLKCTSECSGLDWNRAASRWILEQKWSKGIRGLSDDLSYKEPGMSTDRALTMSYQATIIQVSYDPETVEWY